MVTQMLRVMLFAVGLSVFFTGALPSILTLVGGDPQVVQAATKRPNIVVIYMDDNSPLPTWLWCNKDRTFALARFCRNGVKFENSIGSSPLCCPGEANVLSGKYGHNNGVTRNDVRKFNLRYTIAVKLQKSGYHTGYFGKYFNGFAREAPTRKSVLKFAQGWNNFDVIWHNQGRFFDYRLWTRSGVKYYGRGPKDHSTYVSGVGAARYIRNVPKSKPLFAFVHFYDGHNPNTPMARFKRAKCNVSGWKGPAYNEADVSDKPGYVKKRKKLSRENYSLKKRCKGFKGVNLAVNKIRQALKKTGRLNNTLFILTADNGWLMGDHRLTGKTHAYSTPVPLYMLWPKVLGNVKRVVEEPVSNVDFARTFCAIAGCTMPNSDGRNILPLIKGKVDYLDRCFVYEEMLHPGPHVGGRPAWRGVRSTLKCFEDRWVYTEYKGGFRELYNTSEDKHQKNNLAGKPAYAEIQADLRRMLQKVVRRDGVKYFKSRLR